MIDPTSFEQFQVLDFSSLQGRHLPFLIFANYHPDVLLLLLLFLLYTHLLQPET